MCRFLSKGSIAIRTIARICETAGFATRTCLLVCNHESEKVLVRTRLWETGMPPAPRLRDSCATPKHPGNDASGG